MKELENTIKELACELSNVLQDYENWKVITENVIKWVNQFEEVDATDRDKVAILKNLIKVFRVTYFSKNRIISLLSELNKKYEKKLDEISFLDIQDLRDDKTIYKISESQKNLVNLLKDINSHIIVNDFNKGKFIYLDDYLLSGGSLERDIEVLKELKIDLKKVELKYLCILLNSWDKKTFEKTKKLLNNFASYQCEICLHSYWEYWKLNDSKRERVFFEDKVDNSNLVKNLFLKANEYIIEKISDDKKKYWDSKKKSIFISATYKNIPNNAPICLWWGDEDSYWFPLLKRKEKKKENLIEDINEMEWLQNL